MVSFVGDDVHPGGKAERTRKRAGVAGSPSTSAPFLLWLPSSKHEGFELTLQPDPILLLPIQLPLHSQLSSASSQPLLLLLLLLLLDLLPARRERPFRLSGGRGEGEAKELELQRETRATKRKRRGTGEERG